MLHYFIVLNTMKSHLLECVVMQNYKVEVKNHSEGMEAQDLFLKMGFRKGVCIDSRYPKLIVTDNYDDDWYSAGAMIYYSKECKQITLQELRAMVAPKQKEYLVKTDTGYTLQVLSDVVDGHDGIIEVPEGSNIAWKDNSNGFVFFTKMEMGYRDATVIWQRESLNDQVASAEEYRKSFSGIPKATLDAMNNIQNAFEKAQSAINAQNAMAKLFTLSGVAHGKEFILNPNQKKDESKLFDTGKFILEYFTQPEELPFVDDEPKLRNIKIRVNGDFDKALEAIQNMGYWNCQFNRIPRNCYWLVGNADATVDYGSEQHMYIDHHVEYFVDGAIDKTQETLNERKSTYGDFKDVSGMTQELLAVMEQYGYSDMPDMHKEALHMICSKMARIVNGDHNHLDSWHDIAGYAKLIENNIK